MRSKHKNQAGGCISSVAKTFHQQLGRFLRQKRGELTYKQFERKLGISYVTIHRLECGEQNVTLKTLEQICKRLKCRMADIFPD